MYICQTLTLIEEMKTEGHSPLKFLCNDGNTYYCKHRIRPKIEELDFLIYETVSHALLRSLQIPTPDIAFVEVRAGSFLPKQLIANRRLLRPGAICFGSLELAGADLVRETEANFTPRKFDTLLNPADLIRIAMFDVWIDNTDRGKVIDGGHNYNLLRVAISEQTQFVAFDNAFVFGGEDGLRFFSPSQPIWAKNRLWCSPYYKAVVKHIPVAERFTVAQQCLFLCYEQAEQVIDEVWGQIPATWNPLESLRERMVRFLLDKQRKQQLEAMIYQYNQF